MKNGRQPKLPKTAAILAILALVALSPILLIFIGHVVDADWARLSDIGETYGFVSALVSAAALFTVARSITLQTRQERLGHMQAFRAMQAEIARLALDHPDPCRVGLGCATNDDVFLIQQDMFTTLQARYWLAGFEMGEFDEWLVGHEFAESLFSTTAGRDWWRKARPVWVRDGVAAVQIRFSAILDRVLEEQERHSLANSEGPLTDSI